MNDDEFRWKLDSDSVHLVLKRARCISLHSNGRYGSALTGVSGRKNRNNQVIFVLALDMDNKKWRSMCKMDCKWRKREAKYSRMSKTWQSSLFLFLFVEFRLLTHFSCFMCPLQFLKIFLRVLNFFCLLPTHFSLSSGIVGVSFPGTRDCRGSKEPNRRCWFQPKFKLHRRRFSHAIHHMDKEQRFARCTVQPKNKIH